MVKKILTAVLLLALTLPMAFSLGPSSAQAAGNPSSPSDTLFPRYFPETGFWIQGEFRHYWETHGGLPIFGYPITSVFKQDGLYRQYFQRAVFEWHPDNKPPYQVLLMRLGAIMAADRTNENPFKPVGKFANSKDHVYYSQTGHSLNYGFKTYWNNNNGLMNFGYPISEEFDEKNQPPPAGDGQTHTVQYFERTRFEYHPNNPPQYQVLLGLLGQEYLNQHGAPASALQREDASMPPFDPIRSVQYGPHVGYGFNVFTWSDVPSIPKNQKTDDIVKSAGFNWIRIQVKWSDIEATKGQYNPYQLDFIVNAAHKDGLKIVASVAKSPGWENAGGGIPSDTSEFQALMTFLAKRYQGKVQAWEIWNEENLASEMGGHVDVGRYVNLLKAGYSGVKSSDPGAVVLLGGLTPNGVNNPTIAIDDVLYLTKALTYNNGEAKNYFDALAAHPGSNNNPPDSMWPGNPGPGPGWQNNGSFYFRRVEQLRQVMIDQGQAAKQIWLTEFGWTTKNGAKGYEYGAQNSPQDQANYLVRAYQMGRNLYPWMGVMLVWNLNFSVVTPPNDEKYPWAVLNSDWSPRPAFDALKKMPK